VSKIKPRRESAGRRFSRFIQRESLGEELISGNTFARFRRRNSFRKYRRFVWYALLLFFISVIIVAIMVAAFFKVEEITVEGSLMYYKETLSADCGVSVGDSIYTVSRARSERFMKEQFPYINGISLTRILPSSVQITVTEDLPYYYTDISGEFFILSEELRVLQRMDDIADMRYNYNLKELTLPEVAYAVVGRQIRFKRQGSYQYAVDMLRTMRLSELYEKSDHINIRDKYTIFFVYDNSIKIILGDPDDIELRLATAVEIIEQMSELMTTANGLIDVQDVSVCFAIPGADIGI